MSWNINEILMSCIVNLDVCIQFGWIAIILYLIKCREKVQRLSGHCPWIKWTLSMVSVDIVHGLSGHCPWTQWTMSMDSVDIVHGPSFQYSSRTMSMDSVHWVHGLSADGKFGMWLVFTHSGQHRIQVWRRRHLIGVKYLPLDTFCTK